MPSTTRRTRTNAQLVDAASARGARSANARAAWAGGGNPIRPRSNAPTTSPASAAGDELGRGERQHPPVEQPGRQHQHVGREPVPADVAALPDPARADLVQRRGHRAAAQRAAGVVLAVRADEVERIAVVGRRASRPAARSSSSAGSWYSPHRSCAAARPGCRRRPSARTASLGVRPGRRIACSRSPAAVGARLRAAAASGRSGTPRSPAGPTGRAARRAAAGRPGTPCRASGRRAAGPAAHTGRATRAGAGWPGVFTRRDDWDRRRLRAAAAGTARAARRRRGRAGRPA